MGLVWLGYSWKAKETQGRAGVLVGGQMTWSLTRHSRELQFPSKSLKDLKGGSDII